MDHVGDMLHYLQTGLEQQGYRGILAWNGVDRYTSPPPENDDWRVSREDRRASAVMYTKDSRFRVTVEEID